MDSSEIKIKKATNESFMTLKSYKSLKNSRISSKKLTNLKTVNFFEEIPNFKKMKVCSLYFRATKREEGADVAFVPLSVAFLFILISFLRENPGNTWAIKFFFLFLIVFVLFFLSFVKKLYTKYIYIVLIYIYIYILYVLAENGITREKNYRYIFYMFLIMLILNLIKFNKI